MVAKVISGKDIKGAINYNELKVMEGRAVLIDASGFLKNASALSFREKLARFNSLNQLNERTRTNTFHISLNFDPSEKFNEEMLCRIASAYMEKVGFGNQPYLLYEHHDAAHPHVHIVTSIIQPDGTRIGTHNFGKLKSEPARKEVEVEFDLIRASSKVKHEVEAINLLEIDKPVYGRSATRASISKVVRAITTTYKYTSLPELNAALSQYNIAADRGSEKSRMFQKRGLIYSLLDERGNRIGIPVKSSSIYGKPTLSFLERQFKLGEVSRQRYRDSLKKSIDETLASRPETRIDFVSAMRLKGVTVLFRSNAEGRIYGVTFVDNNSRTVFNGSALGKQYSAASLAERLHKREDEQPVPARVCRTISNEKTEPSEQPPIDTSSVIKDLITSDTFDPRMPYAPLGLNSQKRKKRKSRRL